MSIEAKIRLFNTNVLNKQMSVLLYGAETGRITKLTKNKIHNFINSCLRKMLQIRWSDTISKDKLWEKDAPGPIRERNQEMALDRPHASEIAKQDNQ